VEAIVLGGSRARGQYRADSDVDIGIYYDATRLDLPALEKVARELNDEPRENLIAPPGGWGPWVNAGGWLTVDGQRVDLILRDLARVEQVIVDARKGLFSSNYQPGHPHAFVSVMYMGELAICQILWDRAGKVAQLQAEARVYPPALKQAIVHTFGFEAGFSSSLAETYARKDELYYVVAHLVRAVSCLNQVVFALNDEYCLNEKRAVLLADGFPICPANYKARVDTLFALGGSDPAQACAILRELVAESQSLSAA
jgi:predicted nucleotidyltransferase